MDRDNLAMDTIFTTCYMLTVRVSVSRRVTPRLSNQTAFLFMHPNIHAQHKLQIAWSPAGLSQSLWSDEPRRAKDGMYMPLITSNEHTNEDHHSLPRLPPKQEGYKAARGNLLVNAAISILHPHLLLDNAHILERQRQRHSRLRKLLPPLPISEPEDASNNPVLSSRAILLKCSC
jgi:hypothetical protein